MLMILLQPLAAEPVSRDSERAQLILIVRPESGGIKHDRLIVICVCGDVTIPDITVQETWLDLLIPGF